VLEDAREVVAAQLQAFRRQNQVELAAQRPLALDADVALILQPGEPRQDAIQVGQQVDEAAGVREPLVPFVFPAQQDEVGHRTGPGVDPVLDGRRRQPLGLSDAVQHRLEASAHLGRDRHGRNCTHPANAHVTVPVSVTARATPGSEEPIAARDPGAA
jgi:hypothetical protein